MNIKNCCNFISSAQSCSLEGDVRLVNGSNSFEGLVDFCHNETWTNVCAFNWDVQEATVVCRQLGFAGNLNR